MNMRGEIIDCNSLSEEISGYKKEELIGKNFLEFPTLPKKYIILIAESFKKLLKGEIPEPREIQLYNKEKNLMWVHVSVSLIKFRGENLIQILIQDINELKEAELNLKKSKKKLEKTLEALKRSNENLQHFAYIASHDLQEPLRMVTSYTQLLERRYKDKLDDSAIDFINFAMEGASRMKQLINALLAYSRVDTRGKPFESLNCEDILETVLSNLRVSIMETNAEITNDPLPNIMVDNTQMIQLFQNLIGNAIKFKGDNPPRIHVSAKKENHEWIFSVKDNGIGIDKKYFERIFVIFQRLHTREEYSGSGIGLAICKKIVERHGGKIWVESELEKGTTFYFSIPIKNNHK